MPYKDKATKIQRQRERRGEAPTEAPLNEALKGEAPVFNEAPLEVPPAIVRAITDPKRRSKVERISQELNSRGLGRDVRYGIDGPTFDVVKELLEVTRPESGKVCYAKEEPLLLHW